MGWSTREIAEMAGTTISAIRYYHRIGLLDEPDRRANGYKQYGAAHLARVLQIRRLREISIPLEELSRDIDGETTASRLRRIDAELAAGIERLERARTDIAVMLRTENPLAMPPGFENVDDRLSEPDRALLWIYGASMDEPALASIRRAIEVEPADISAEYVAVDDATSEERRRQLAERIAVLLASQAEMRSWIETPITEPQLAQTLQRAVADLYNDAQLDVLGRAIVLAAERRRSAAGP